MIRFLYLFIQIKNRNLFSFGCGFGQRNHHFFSLSKRKTLKLVALSGVLVYKEACQQCIIKLFHWDIIHAVGDKL